MSRGFQRSFGAREGNRWASYGKQPVADMQPDDIEKVVVDASGVKLADDAAEALRLYSEDGLNPDFLEDAGIETVLEHLKDVVERINDQYTYSKAASKQGMTAVGEKIYPGNLEEKANAARLKPALKAVQLAIKKIESGQ